MKGRTTLIVLALLAAGAIVLPQTVTLFAGQHYWYNISSMGNDIPCEKCHADVAEEMQQIHGPHTNETGYGRFECEYCHRTFPISIGNINQTISQNYLHTYATVNSSVIPGKEAHAASTVPCMYCHSGKNFGKKHSYTFTAKYCTCHGTDDGGDPNYYHGDRFYVGSSDSDPGECIKCHGTGDGKDTSTGVIHIPPAGGFNLTANSTDTGTLAAHKKFVDKSMNNNLMEDANEACIACHTNIAVKINFSHKRSLVFKAGLGYPVTTEHGPHNWTLAEWTTNGTAYATVFGNTTGYGMTSYNESWPGNIDSIYQ